MTISVVGLGKLGLCTAACFARKGFSVIGYDNDSSKINKLNNGECYIDEPKLSDMLDGINFSNDIKYAFDESTETFIIVPTPSDGKGWFSNDYIMSVLKNLIDPIKASNIYHTINIVSTVMPGSCEKFIHYLESATSLKCGKDFGLTYNPEFIAIGAVIDNFMNPDMVLIGGSDPVSIDCIKRYYEPICQKIHCMSLINAEITKLSINCFLTTKISFVNELASICERVPGANIDDITNAMGDDSRIGKKLMRAGLGYSGPCLPRDTVAMNEFAKYRGCDSEMSTSSDLINKRVVGRIIQKIIEHIPYNGIIDIYGSSYKSGTKLTEGSQSIILQETLKKMGYNVRMFENPFILNQDKYPHAIVMMQHIPIDLDQFPKCLFIDPWRNFPQASEKFTYYAMGVGSV